MNTILNHQVLHQLRRGCEVLRNDGTVFVLQEPPIDATLIGRRVELDGWRSCPVDSLGLEEVSTSFVMHYDPDSVTAYDRGFLDGYNAATLALTTPKVHPRAVEALAAHKSGR